MGSAMDRVGGRLTGMVNRLKPSPFLVVKIAPSGSRFRIFIPVPVAPVIAVIEAIGFWSSIVAKLGLLGLRTHSGRLSLISAISDERGREFAAKAIAAAPEAIEDIWRSMISRGAWTLVDIRAHDGTEVSIRFM